MKHKLGKVVEHEKNESPSEEAGESKELHDYEIANHIETLHKAEKLKGDEKMMKMLQPHIEKHKAAANKITSIAQLKAVAKQKISEPE